MHPRPLKHPLYLHDDLLSTDTQNPINNHPQLKKRATLLLTQLGTHGQAGFKGVTGENAGWRRSPLGGNGGMQYYLWWCAHSSPPVKGRGFPAGSVIVRAAREHDDTSKAISADSLNHYTRFETANEAEETVGEPPWTSAQLDFINGDGAIRLLRGQPGSGKTTSLWRAVEVSGAGRVLYLTWSSALALRAQAHFDVMAPQECEVVAQSLEGLWGELLGSDLRRGGGEGVKTISAAPSPPRAPSPC